MKRGCQDYLTTRNGEKIAIKDLPDYALLFIKTKIEILVAYLNCGSGLGYNGDTEEYVTPEKIKERYNYDGVCREVKRRGLL